MDRRFILLALAATLSVGCQAIPSDVGGGPIVLDESVDWLQPIENRAEDCSVPGFGCSCDGEEAPIGCYLEPGTDDLGRTICTNGVRYCRDREWSRCEALASWVLRSDTALIDGPVECNACDPACATSTDAPGPGDVTPTNSDDVEYDATIPGVRNNDVGTLVDSLPDGDGDGVPDDYDTFPSDSTRDGFTENGGLFAQLPFGASSGPDSLTFSTALQAADVYFILDHSGSMGTELSNVQASLTTGTFNGCSGGIMGAIRCIIPDAWIGIGSHVDYAYSTYGGVDDVVWQNRQNLTDDTAAAQTAANGVMLDWGYDWAESQTQAIYAAVTGSALDTYQSGTSGCGAGFWGYPCFREDVIPIIVLITDAPFHNGPTSRYDYSPFEVAPTQPWVSGNDAVATLHDLGDITGNWVGANGQTDILTDVYNFGCSAGAPEAVFRFTLSTTQRTTISTAGSSYDTVVSLQRVSDGATWCNDDSGGSQSGITRTLTPGDYYIFVDGWSTSSGEYRLSVGVPAYAPPTWEETVTALTDRGVKVITVESSGGDSTVLNDVNTLSNATGSVNSSGAPFVFSIASDGTGISSAIVDAVQDLADYSTSNVTAVVNDNTTTGAVDERDFVDSIVAVSFPAGRCSGISADFTTFEDCLPGTNVVFDATLRNDVVTPTSVIQEFNFTISIFADGTFLLDTVPVRIIVPPEVAIFEPEGEYWRDYDSTLSCASNERPDWNELDWDVTVPAGTSVRFELRTSDDLSTLAAATPVTFTVPSASPTIDVGDELVAAGAANFLPYLRVTAVLISSADQTVSPVLTRMSQQYVCSPTE